MADGTTETPTQTEALVERLFGAAIGMLEMVSIHLGYRLGFYQALDEGDPATPAELASRTGTAERYVREWLEQQAVAGFLSVDNVDADAKERCYGLPAAYRSVFVEEGSLSYLAPLATLAIGVLEPLEALLAAYRGGGGVPYEAYGAGTRDGISALNRPMFAHQLAGWLGAIPEVDTRLRAEPPARIGDIACGSGWSSIALARAYPLVVVDAIDVDPASIETAQANVAAADLGHRIRPLLRDASDPPPDGRYDLITIFEALHDMNHPVEALKSARAMLAAGGSVVIADERVAERFTAPGDEQERFSYGWSILHCLPVGMLDEDSAGTGTMIRPDILRSYAAEAGFGRTDVLPIEHDSWRFYRLVP